MKRELMILFALLISIGKINAQDFSELEKTIADEIREKNAVGAAIAIVKDDKIRRSRMSFSPAFLN